VAYLLNRIQHALELDAKMRQQKTRQANEIARMSLLTPREREVMQWLAQGKTPKEIALGLDICRKTVDVHRSHIMTKLAVDSVIDLARMVQVSRSTIQPDARS